MRVPRFSVYQLGRGNEPVIVVGSMMSLVPRYIARPPVHAEKLHSMALRDFVAIPLCLRTRWYIGGSVKQQTAVTAMATQPAASYFSSVLGTRPRCGQRRLAHVAEKWMPVF